MADRKLFSRSWRSFHSALGFPEDPRYELSALFPIDPLYSFATLIVLRGTRDDNVRPREPERPAIHWPRVIDPRAPSRLLTTKIARRARVQPGIFERP